MDKLICVDKLNTRLECAASGERGLSCGSIPNSGVVMYDGQPYLRLLALRPQLAAEPAAPGRMWHRVRAVRAGATTSPRSSSSTPTRPSTGAAPAFHIIGGGCLTLQYISNVIIHNVHIHHGYQSGETNIRSSPTHYGWPGKSDGDGISVFGARDIWIDHCSMSHCKDGLIDVVMGSTGVTISNNHFSHHHHNEVMLLGHSDDYLPDSGMQVTIAFNHFGKKLIQRMQRCRRGYIHVVNNDFTRWEMYAIWGSGNPTINSQGNRYIAPYDRNAKEVTKRVDTAEGDWRGWNWRSEGDIMANGAYFVASGQGVESSMRRHTV
ncbi:hypothetical protein SASPL_102228 [Salvia splendens]|uniref:Pectate lyase n=1 Tax=Salvia splendens TaxID=180675 RepID=A0A8X8YS67_SALSN|nr:hypothetical protein SASPL_102228 [Salvia splendens]